LYAKRLDGIYHIIERKTRIETRVKDIVSDNPRKATASLMSSSSTRSSSSMVGNKSSSTAVSSSSNSSKAHEQEDPQKSLRIIQKLLHILE